VTHRLQCPRGYQTLKCPCTHKTFFSSQLIYIQMFYSREDNNEHMFLFGGMLCEKNDEQDHIQTGEHTPDEAPLVPGIGPHGDHLIHCAVECKAEVTVRSGLKARQLVAVAAVPHGEFVVYQAQDVPELLWVGGGDHLVLELYEVEAVDGCGVVVGRGGHDGS
jgi:hypothetical protein